MHSMVYVMPHNALHEPCRGSRCLEPASWSHTSVVYYVMRLVLPGTCTYRIHSTECTVRLTTHETWKYIKICVLIMPGPHWIRCMTKGVHTALQTKATAIYVLSELQFSCPHGKDVRFYWEGTHTPSGVYQRKTTTIVWRRHLILACWLAEAFFRIPLGDLFLATCNEPVHITV